MKIDLRIKQEDSKLAHIFDRVWEFKIAISIRLAIIIIIQNI